MNSKQYKRMLICIYQSFIIIIIIKYYKYKSITEKSNLNKTWNNIKKYHRRIISGTERLI